MGITRGVTKNLTPTPVSDANYNNPGVKTQAANAKNGVLPGGKKIKTTRVVS